MNNIYSSRPAEVLKIRKHTSSEWSFLLRTEIKAIPGQFVMLSLPKTGEIPVSISGFDVRGIEVTIRNVGRITGQVFKSSRPGGQFYIRGPYGYGFPLAEFEDRHLLIMVGGSAIAAVKPLVEYYIGENNSKLKNLDILAGFKSPRHILFRKELALWRKKCNVIVTVDNDEDYAWMGSIGFVVDFVKDIKNIGNDTMAIVIGPPLMMKNSVQELICYDLRETNIYLSFERHMKCGVGKCGHCRIRDKYVCVDGPVFSYKDAKDLID
ncbi:MAG: FAD/NAD(P)-binding protein [Nitrospirota bacterium]